MYFRFLIRFILLAAGFALTTAGLLSWQQINFDLSRVWPVAAELSAHPIYLLIFGLALIPPTLWEIFLLENRGPGER
ncbi:MAG: hypothetical protein ACFHXK_13720 [bacterium]